MSDEDLLIINYVVIIGSVLMCVLLFLCNFGLVGTFGELISRIMFGFFGKMAYVFPIFLIVFAFLWISKQSDNRLTAKFISAILLFIAISIFFEVSNGYSVENNSYSISGIFLKGADFNAGGGIS